MRIPRVYTDQPLTAGDRIELPPETSHYLTRVLRLSANAAVRLFNGKGGSYGGVILTADKSATQVQLEEFDPDNLASPLRVHLGIVVSRGERMDLVMQKATELGVSAITPLFSERCEVKLKGERLTKKQTHWRKVSISACEQSGLNLLPDMHPAEQLQTWLQASDAELKLVLHPGTEQPLPADRRPESVALLIGPEGGFSDLEIEQASATGFTPLQLGPRILRTETAPIAALTILQYQWGDLGG